VGPIVSNEKHPEEGVRGKFFYQGGKTEEQRENILKGNARWVLGNSKQKGAAGKINYRKKREPIGRGRRKKGPHSKKKFSVVPGETGTSV